MPRTKRRDGSTKTKPKGKHQLLSLYGQNPEEMIRLFMRVKLKEVKKGRTKKKKSG